MRNGQNNKRMRGRNNNNNNNNNNRRGQNPMTRVFESNGPDIKIRGTASHIAEKYVQLARDARGSGDPVASENYYQHAEHYFRLIATAQEQFRQNQPQQQPHNTLDIADEGEDAGDGYSNFGAEPGFVPVQQQPFPPRDNPRDNQRDRPREQRFQPRDNEQSREQQPNERAYREQRAQPQPQPDYQAQPAMPPLDSGVDRLPSFITGGQPQSGNGFESNGQPSGDRFPPRRRRRPHGTRAETNAAPAAEEVNSGNE
ncbi:DUF4167 domain-containing protein [Nitrobacteraceae bacterium UC4446_H13]|jgi:hypothetical protein